jgi:antitoxin MazE7
MTGMATIRVPRVVRDRLRDAAKAAHLTPGQLIEEMLDQRRKAAFWAALEAETADQVYREELVAADEAFIAEAEERLAQFEAGQ